MNMSPTEEEKAKQVNFIKGFLGTNIAEMVKRDLYRNKN